MQAIGNALSAIWEFISSTISDLVAYLKLLADSAGFAKSFIDGGFVPSFAVTMVGGSLAYMLIKLILGRENE